ncbi:MAG: DNA mismatch repair endonuclease MutL [Flavobacteriales bacterium]|nr:DNA mismatch repair endonuclease MutL [Flavobacteriales bacterium]
MADIISLLPEAVANQIAAGEVVQRPASVVKELMENAIDAGATQIKLIVKDAGKTLIQVIDNGRGMSETDARMCFERHATSKIRKSDDLFHIVSKGFRGEALASIAAVAQVEMKTRQRDRQLGTLIEIDASKVKTQEPTQCPEGAIFSVKNLFYNVPARRYFLKSDAIEFRHILDDFLRLALTHPEIEFVCTHNGSEVFSLPIVPIRQRIVHVFGSKYNEKLVPVEENTDIVSVTGFVGKPDAARKTRGEQYFFVNHRFIRNSYLHHAVMSAFEELLPAGHFPLYLIYLTIDPAQIDINIHPTKTEIKFQDERAVYAIIHAAVRRALGRFNISPSLDFNQENAITIGPPRSGQDMIEPEIRVNKEYNPFANDHPRSDRTEAMRGWFERREQTSSNWQELHQISLELNQKTVAKHQPDSDETMIAVGQESGFEWTDDTPVTQLHRKYIMLITPKGLMLVDQQRAHQRILYEGYLRQMEKGQGHSQQLMFPTSLEFGAADMAMILSGINELGAMGFDLVQTDEKSIEVLGLPADAGARDAQSLMEEFLEQWHHESGSLKYAPREKMAWALAAAASIRYGQMLTQPEMTSLVRDLFQCAMPYAAQYNRPTILQITLDQLDQQFR